MGDVLPKARRWWALVGLTLAVITFDLNLTMVNVALPTLATELDASAAQLQWFSNAYSLMVAATLLPAGLIGDRYGPKRPLILALVVLGVTAALCSQANSAEQLIAGQLVMGMASGFLPALSLALVNMLFPHQERARALAVWSAGMTLGIPLGPIVGGFLLTEFWWGALYLLTVPLALVGTAMLAFLLPSGLGSRDVRLDLLGAVLSGAGIVLLVHGLTLAGESGWNAPPVLLSLTAGTVVLALFVLWTRKTEHPILDLDLFRARAFVGGAALATLVTFTLMGAIFTLPQYFHIVHGADPLGTGLRLLPIVGGLTVGILATDLLRSRTEPRIVLAAGFASLTLAGVLGANTSVDHGYLFTATWLTIAGVGIGFALPTAMDIAMGSVPKDRNGVGSGVLQAIRQVGGTFGVAVLGTLLANTYSTHVDVSGLSEGGSTAVRRTAAAGLEYAREHGSPELLESVRASFVAGMGATLWVTAVVAALGCVLSLFLAPSTPTREVRETAPTPNSRGERFDEQT